MYRSGWSTLKAYCNSGTTIIPVTTGVPVDVFWANDRAPNASESIQLLRGDRKTYLKENAVKMMGPYDPAEHLARFIK